MNTPKVDFTNVPLSPSQDVLEIKGCIAFELHNKGLADLTVENITLKRGDMQVFTPPIPGAVFATNKRYQFSNPATANAVLIKWIALPPNDCN